MDIGNNIIKLKQRFELVGNSELFLRSIRKALRVANTDISILVTGESGTGKDVIAQAIHKTSQRKGPFITVNCAAIPAELIERCSDQFQQMEHFC